MLKTPWIAYWRERFRLRVFGPAAVALALAAQPRAGLEAMDIISALLLLAQFRLWDDLADRERDRSVHPARVLVTTPSIAPFVAGCAALAAMNVLAAAWSRTASGASATVALDVAAAAWYAWRPVRRSITTDLILLLKYPGLVLVLSEGTLTSGGALTLSTASAYVLACAFEVWHDPSAPLREAIS